MPWERFYWTWW